MLWFSYFGINISSSFSSLLLESLNSSTGPNSSSDDSQKLENHRNFQFLLNLTHIPPEEFDQLVCSYFQAVYRTLRHHLLFQIINKRINITNLIFFIIFFFFNCTCFSFTFCYGLKVNKFSNLFQLTISLFSFKTERLIKTNLLKRQEFPDIPFEITLLKMFCFKL